MSYLTIRKIFKGLTKLFKEDRINKKLHLKQKKVGLSYVAWNPKHKSIIKAYYDFCISEITTYLKKNKINKNIIFGQYNHVFSNMNPVIRIDLQYEHTLVKSGARDSENAKKSKTPLIGKKKYLVRLADEGRIRSLDVVIDYSWPNYIHIKNSEHYNWLTNKYFVISPMLYKYKNLKIPQTKRTLETITLFNYPDKGRRALFLKSLRRNKIKCQNIRHCFKNIEAVYRQTKILVNIHQTDEHVTFEELRVLPALLCGAIIISEHSPLTRYCGYEDFILWANIDEIPKLIVEVQNNYEKYWNKIFGNQKFATNMAKLKDKNKEAILRILKKIS